MDRDQRLDMSLRLRSVGLDFNIHEKCPTGLDPVIVSTIPDETMNLRRA